MFLNAVNNFLFNSGRYRTVDEAVIVACFFNPLNNPYRLLAFRRWYSTIKHLPHRIIECVTGDAKPQLPASKYITTVRSDSVLWHKEGLLNKLIRDLPSKFKYVVWCDADVVFSNLDWFVQTVERLQTAKIVQPFEYCQHLTFDQSYTSESKYGSHFERFVPATHTAVLPTRILPGNTKALWRGFAANYADGLAAAKDLDYDIHGHVGFVWAARREVLEKCPLYDKALVGGADHIIAHAAAGDIEHPCVANAFKDDLPAVVDWSRYFSYVVDGKMSYVPGNLYHLWHGDLKNRQYLKRVKEFTKVAKDVVNKDVNGLYEAAGKDKYVRDYLKVREPQPRDAVELEELDAQFAADMGYSLVQLMQSVASTEIADATPPSVINTPEEADAVRAVVGGAAGLTEDTINNINFS